MRKFLAALTLSATVLFNSYVAPPAQAQTKQHPDCLDLPSGVTLKVIDPSTVICKNQIDGDEWFSLYRRGKSLENFTVTLVHVKSADVYLISIYEPDPKTLRFAQFYIEGRKFKKWVSPKDENLEMLNKYRKFVTILLDAKEEYSNIPEF